MSVRSDLAAILKQQTAVQRLNVYDYGADIVKLPALVIVNADPMLAVNTFGTVEYGLDAQLHVLRTVPAVAVEQCEAFALQAANLVVPTNFRFNEAAAPVESSYNDLQTMLAVVSFTAKLQLRT